MTEQEEFEFRLRLEQEQGGDSIFGIEDSLVSQIPTRGYPPAPPADPAAAAEHLGTAACQHPDQRFAFSGQQ